MTLRRRLALRYAAVVGVCFVLLGGLGYHEFVVEPRVRRELGQAKPSGSAWGEIAEMVLHALIPVTLGLGWWFLRRTLAPIDDLALRVEKLHAGNLDQRLPSAGGDDEVSRLTATFNAMSERLERAFRRIHEFTLQTSHELKTPLTVMRVELENCLAAGEAGPHRQRFLSLLDEVQRLTRIVDGLALLGKGDIGLVGIERQPVAWERLVAECFEDLQVLAEDRGLEARLEACEPAPLLGDADRLKEVLLNLADNAVKYNQPGGFVRMALHRRDDHAELTLTNSGPGIPAAMQERIFDRFVRGSDGHPAGGTARDGCGLGLAICRWIVRAHGGSIRVESTEGGPTTFTVILPVVPEAGGERIG